MTISRSKMVSGTALLCGLGAGIVTAWFLFAPFNLPLVAAEECITENDLDCMLLLMEESYGQEGPGAAFDVFDYFYNRSDLFASAGCHLLVHRIGDYAYYHDYSKHQDWSKMDFPDSTASCGHGFHHSLVEHAVQNNPSPAFIVETCDYLTERLGKRMPDIRNVCFQGAGNGIMLVQAESITNEQWGNSLAFAESAMEQCESLPGISTSDTSLCRQGAFNTLSLWMFEGEFGLRFDMSTAFPLCRQQEGEGRRGDCYHDIGQLIDVLSGFDLAEAARITQAEMEYFPEAKQLMSIAASSILQQTNQTLEEASGVLSECLSIQGDLKDQCIIGVVKGLMVQGPLRMQFSKGIALCSLDMLDAEEAETCNSMLFDRMHVFLPEEEHGSHCRAAEENVMFQRMCQENGIEL